jgi:hypothetical protein
MKEYCVCEGRAMEKADSQFQLPNEEGFKLKVLQSTLDVDFLTEILLEF